MGLSEEQIEAGLSENIGKLTPRQELFVSEYLKDLNGTRAAIRAGYAPNSAAETGSYLLRLPKVAFFLEKAKEQRLLRVNVTQDNVLDQMAILANSSIDHYYVDDDGQVQLTDKAPEGAMGAIQKVKRRKTVKMDKDENIFVTYDVEITLWNKPEPLKLMGRHVGLFADRVEHTGPKGGPIEFASLTNEQLAERAMRIAELARSLRGKEDPLE